MKGYLSLIGSGSIGRQCARGYARRPVRHGALQVGEATLRVADMVFFRMQPNGEPTSYFPVYITF